MLGDGNYVILFLGVLGVFGLVWLIHVIGDLFCSFIEKRKISISKFK